MAGPTLLTPNPDDAISAQNVDLYIAGSSSRVGGMESFDARVQIPKEVQGATDGRSRFRRTGPITVQWTAGRILLHGQSFLDLMGPNFVPNQQNYGNYNWDAAIFDIVHQFQSVNPTGVVTNAGGWTVTYATITEYGAGHSDAYQFWMENVQGIALGFYQQGDI